MPRTRSEDAARSTVGSLLAGASLLLLVVGLTMGPARQWPGWAVALLVLARVGLACFGAHQVWREPTGQEALMPRRWFG